MRKDYTQQLFDERKEMLSRIDDLSHDEMRELIDIEMTLVDKGFSVESHEDLWIEMQGGEIPQF